MNENEPLWLRDMIVLGHGAPNTLKKLGGRQGRCVCLWSKEKGYCRIYPVPYQFLSDWQIIDVKVIKSNTDNRKNSYAVYHYLEDWLDLGKNIQFHWTKTPRGKRIKKKLNRKEWIQLSKELAKDTMSKIIEEKESFGIIKPKNIDLILEQNDKREKSGGQLNLFAEDLDDLIMNQSDYRYIPKIVYDCEGECTAKSQHKQKIVSWEAYAYMKKNPDSLKHCEKIKKGYHIGDPNYEHYILVGNIKNYPKSYIVVKLIRFKKEENKQEKEDKHQTKLTQ